MGIVAKPQLCVPSRDRKAVASLKLVGLFNTQNPPQRFQSCFLLRAREHWQEDLEADLDSRRWAGMGKNECSRLADVVSAALASFFDPGVCPPKHDRCLQREPNGSSRASRRFHPLTPTETLRIRLQNSS